jgi:hypothetical protein
LTAIPSCLRVLKLKELTATIISDIDYLDSLPETSAMYLNGSAAIAFSTFSAIASGSATYTYAALKNLALSIPAISVASSEVQVTAIASGGNIFASASAASRAAVSS